MAVLTIEDNVMLAVEKFAEKEERSRDEIVNEAIEAYLRRKKWNKIFAEGSALAATHGITEKDVNDAVREAQEE